MNLRSKKKFGEGQHHWASFYESLKGGGEVMNTLLAKALGAIKKLFYYAAEYLLIAVQWKLRWLRVQLRRWKRCSAQKEVDKAYSKLGAEVFALYRGGQTDFRGMPLVDQKLKLVEEAEGGLFAVDDEIDAINNEYREKKAAISSHYQMKRTSVGDSTSQ
jgi:hypothetical protein